MSFEDKIKILDQFIKLSYKKLYKNEDIGYNFNNSELFSSLEEYEEFYQYNLSSKNLSNDFSETIFYNWIKNDENISYSTLFLEEVINLFLIQEDLDFSDLPAKVQTEILDICRDDFKKLFFNKETSMNSERSLAKRVLDATSKNVKNVSKKVVIRQAAKQYAKTFNVALVGVLKKYGIENPLILGLLQSEAGQFIPGIALTYGVSALPLSEEYKNFLLDVGEELQVSGAEVAVEPFVSALMEPLQSILLSSINSLSLPGMPAMALPPSTEKVDSIKSETKSTKSKRTSKNKTSSRKSKINIKNNDNRIEIKQVN